MPGFREPTSGMSEWFNRPAFNRYWTHYSMVQDWLKQCRRSQEMASYRAFHDMNYVYYEQQPVYQPQCCVTETQPYYYHHQPPVPIPQEGEALGGHPVHYDNQMDAQETAFTVNEEGEGEAECEEGSEFEMVVSEEWIALIKHSEQFRRQRDALKQAEERLRERVEFVELGSFQKNNQKTVGQRTKDEKVSRENEMKRLYGSRASHIRSMEIAMQLTFDRYYDIKKPTLWPVIPLKL